eukprot:2000631-Rhodomonas_salina.4
MAVECTVCDLCVLRGQAQDGGTIALLRNGDVVSIDARSSQRRIEVRLLILLAFCSLCSSSVTFSSGLSSALLSGPTLALRQLARFPVFSSVSTPSFAFSQHEHPYEDKCPCSTLNASNNPTRWMYPMLSWRRGGKSGKLPRSRPPKVGYAPSRVLLFQTPRKPHPD